MILKTLPLPSPSRADDQDDGKKSCEAVRLKKCRKTEAADCHGADRDRCDQTSPKLVRQPASERSHEGGDGRRPGCVEQRTWGAARCRSKDFFDNQRKRGAHGHETAKGQEVEQRKHPGVKPLPRYQLGGERLRLGRKSSVQNQIAAVQIRMKGTQTSAAFSR